MYCLFNLILVSFFGLLCFQQNYDVTGAEILKSKEVQDNNYYKRFSNLKNLYEPSVLAQHKNNATSKQKKKIDQDKKIYRRNVPFQTPFLGIPLSFNNNEQVTSVKQPKLMNMNQFQPGIQKMPTVKPLVKPNETEAERAERIHKSFERLLTFVEIVGQVDNYLSSKWKNLVRTVSNFYEVEDEPYRLTAKQVYGPCPHSH